MDISCKYIYRCRKGKFASANIRQNDTKTRVFSG